MLGEIQRHLEGGKGMVDMRKIYVYANKYMYVTTVNEKEAMNLKDSKLGYMREYEVKKEKGSCFQSSIVCKWE